MHNWFIQHSRIEAMLDQSGNQFINQQNPNYFDKYSKKNQKQIKNKPKTNQTFTKRKDKLKNKSESWEYHEIFKIFTLYSQYGSQWKFMQNLFTQRSANSIKNRFYTVLRTFMKLMFKYHPGIINKLPHEIPSKSILRFYEGREEFEKFNNLGKRIMQEIEYNLESQLLQKIVVQKQQEIIEIYELTFNISLKQEKQIVQSTKKQKKTSFQGSNNQQIQQQQRNEIAPQHQPEHSIKQQFQGIEKSLPTGIFFPNPNNYQGMTLFFPVYGYYQSILSNQNFYNLTGHF